MQLFSSMLLTNERINNISNNVAHDPVNCIMGFFYGIEFAELRNDMLR